MKTEEKKVKIITDSEEIDIYMEEAKEYSLLGVYKLRHDKVFKFYIETAFDKNNPEKSMLRNILCERFLNNKVLEEKMLKTKWFPIYNMEDNIDMVLFATIDEENIYIFVDMEDIYNCFEFVADICINKLSVN